MNKQMIGTIVLALFLAACSSKSVKPEPAAPVENKDMSQSAPKPAEKPQPKDDTAQTKPMEQQKMTVNPLTDPANILSKRSIFFDFDKDEVKPEFRPLVEAHAKYLTTHPNAKVVLQGNADDRGTREYNLALGQRRAASVKKAMNLLNASDKQIETVSFGEEKPRCSEQVESCWSQNRRVDIVYENE